MAEFDPMAIGGVPAANDPREGVASPIGGAIPGQSLADEPGAAPWERPPSIADPEEAVDRLVDKMHDPKHMKQILTMLDAGVAVEALTKVLTFAGFTEGGWTPDVSELIRPAIFTYLLGMAHNAGIKPTLWIKDPAEKEDEEADMTLRMIKSIAPDKYDELVEKGRKHNKPEEELVLPEPPASGGFINRGDV